MKDLEKQIKDYRDMLNDRILYFEDINITSNSDFYESIGYRDGLNWVLEKIKAEKEVKGE